jgi:hypothetical protein
MSLHRAPVLLVSIVALAALVGAAPETEERSGGGRFVMTPVEGGFLRMDTQTGAVSMCQRTSGQWACEAVADDRRALERELERLGAENRELSSTVRRLEEMLAQPDAERGDRRAEKGPTLQLPSEEEVDRALGYMQRLMRKFKEKMRELDSDSDRRSL